MDTTCPICLENIENNNIKLNCNHIFHKNCYNKLVCTNSTLFINCPICRQINYNFKTFKNNKKNLYFICSDKLKLNKCLAFTTKNKPCQNKPYLFNYGLCSCHNKNILKPKYYSIFYGYYVYLYTSQSLKNKKFKTKLYMLDIAKKLIIKHDIVKLEDLLLIFNRYFNKHNYVQYTPQQFYKYHNIDPPPESWINVCYKNKILF